MDSLARRREHSVPDGKPTRYLNNYIVLPIITIVVAVVIFIITSQAGVAY